MTAQRHGRGALDRRQWGLQLVAHHPQELVAQPFELLDRRDVLDDGNRARDIAVGVMDRRRIDQGGDRVAVRQLYVELLGRDALAPIERSAHRQLIWLEDGAVRLPVDRDALVLVEHLAFTERDSQKASGLTVHQSYLRVTGAHQVDAHG